MLSSTHGAQRSLGKEDGKSAIVKFYNETESGVDSLSKLVRGYSSKRKDRRWPCSIFFTLVDCATYVAFKMFEFIRDSNDNHYNFRKELAYELVLPLVSRRSGLSGLRASTKEARRLIGVHVNLESDRPLAVRGRAKRCNFCSRGRDKKAKTSCCLCGRPICPEH